ncbi:MAG: helix-turn-helix transcriptional regulator, partial [Bacteroidales bacterium]|nr:helix-turn-helix transcriptional regulator [Bacteroidales bacterium]
RMFRRAKKEQNETENVLEETIAEIVPSASVLTLSDREKEILGLSAKGMTVSQIADKICLSPETVKWYRKKLLVKLDCSNVAELVSKAKDAGIL